LRPLQSGEAVSAAILALLLSAPVESTGKLTAIYSAGAALDLVSTEWALSTGRVRESNPFMGSRPVRFAANAAFVAVAVKATQKLQESGHPGRARFLKWAFLASRIGLAVHNVHQARRIR
jgi:hypothetical protein